jgi:hypothetical protein
MFSQKTKDTLQVVVSLCLIASIFAGTYALGKKHRECVARGECKEISKEEADKAFVMQLLWR